MICLKNISKNYNQPVLKNISHDFIPGKIYVIKGISGCGKSTLLNILGGLDTEYEGEYKFNSENVNAFNSSQMADFRSKIGYIFQSSLLLSNLTIAQNLGFISGNTEIMECYAKKLHVLHLFDKYPEQLSGGERQRIAVVRALLNNPYLIIADEPTASLDNENSIKIAQTFAEISGKDNIIIIATHESCFDTIADEIIELDYGEVHEIIKNDSIQHNYNETYGNPRLIKGLGIFKYVLLRSKKKIKLKSILPTVLIITILLCCASVYLNFQREYIRKMTDDYPVTVFSLSSGQYARTKNNYNYLVYKNYQIALDDAICLPLFEKKDSGLSYQNVIEYGTFPQRPEEIVVNQEYIIEHFGSKDFQRYIGFIININEQKYTISGILSDLNNEMQYRLVYSNTYYETDIKAKIFMPYDTIKEIGKEMPSKMIMVQLDDLYNNSKTIQSLREELHGPISEWDGIVYKFNSLISAISLIVLLMIVLISIIALLFIKNEIGLELYYRRKEFGYLQVFNVTKKKIARIIILEYSIKSALAFLCALIIFFAIILTLFICTGINGFLPIFSVTIFAAIFVGYVWITVYFPCHKFLKQKIIALITE